MPPKTKGLQETQMKDIKETKKPKARKEMTKAHHVKVITFQEVALSYVKIAERTAVSKTTSFDIVKRDQERLKQGDLTPYTASVLCNGRPEMLTSWKNDT